MQLQGHGCHQKAIELLGIGSEHLRSVEHDRSLRMIPSALDAAIREVRQRGDIPIAVIGNAGTANCGAIDPLDEIADVCAHSVACRRVIRIHIGHCDHMLNVRRRPLLFESFQPSREASTDHPNWSSLSKF